jgi:hypothetical protein
MAGDFYPPGIHAINYSPRDLHPSWLRLADPKDKPKRPTNEECISRAIACAKRSGKIANRYMVFPMEAAEDSSAGYMVLAEFGGGEMGIFVGAADPELDAFWVVGKRATRDVAEFSQRCWERA